MPDYVELPVTSDLVADRAGNVLKGQTVTVKLRNSATVATHYKSDGTTGTTGSLIVRSDGTVGTTTERRYFASGVPVDVTVAGRTRKVEPLSASVERRIVNVQSFTAGAGLADETAGVQEALDAVPANGVAYFPTGVYIVTDVEPKAGTTMTGPGTLKQKDSSAIGACVINVETGITDVTIDGLTIDGNKTNQTDGRSIHGMRIASDRVTVRNCYIHDTEYNGVSFQEGAANGKVLGCTITDCGTANDAIPEDGWGHGVNGEAASGVTNVLIEGCYIARTGQHGVRGGSDIHHWTVQGNHFETIGHDAFAAYNAGNIALSFIGNTIDTTREAGTHIGGTNLLAADNNMRAIGGAGVLFGSTPNTDPTASAGGVISGNNIFDTEDVAIESRNFSQLSVTGNRIDNSTAISAADQGILISGDYGATPVTVTDITVSGNVVKEATGSGVQIGHATDVTFVGNTSNANGSRGLRLVGVARITIANNVIVGNASDGITSDGTTPSDITLTGNVIMSNTLIGVRNSTGGRVIVSGNVIRSNSGGQLTLTGTDNVVGENNDLGVAQATVNSTNASFTLTPFTSARHVIFTAVLTNTRNGTLSTTNAQVGMKFRVTRTAASTGAFNIDFGTGLKNIATGQWAEATFDGSAWVLTAFGSL